MSGIVTPYSFYPTSASRTFPNIHVGKGVNSKYDQGLGVADSLTSNGIWALRFLMPPVIPSETMKLKLLALADAQTGNAQVNPAWQKASPEDDPSSLTLVAEGTSQLSWSSGDDDVYKELKIVLNAATLPSGNDVIVMNLQFIASGWTLAKVSTWILSIIWE